MRHPRRRHPEVEALESVTFLSSAMAAFHHSTAAVVRAHATTSHQVTITGSASGSYSATTGSDGSKSYVFSGSGTVNPFGAVGVTVSVTVPHSGTNPSAASSTVQATGTVVLSNANGSITFSITGPAADMASRHPDVFQYTITSATGAYQGATASGYLNFAVSPTTTGSSEHGSFQITFIKNGSPPPP